MALTILIVSIMYFWLSLVSISVCFDTSKKPILYIHIANASSNSEFIVFMNCTTSIPPLGDVADLLLNDKTVASVSYYNNTCIAKRKSCVVNECACTPYYYMLNFTTQLTHTQNNFTCQLRFNENKGHEIVLKTVRYRGLAFIDEDVITDKAGQSNDTKESNAAKKKENPGLVHILLPCGILLLVVIVIVAAKCLRKGRRTASKKTKTKCIIGKTEENNQQEALLKKTERDKENITAAELSTSEEKIVSSTLEEDNIKETKVTADSYSQLDMSQKRRKATSEAEISTPSLNTYKEATSTPSVYYSSNDVATSKATSHEILDLERAQSEPEVFN